MIVRALGHGIEIHLGGLSAEDADAVEALWTRSVDRHALVESSFRMANLSGGFAARAESMIREVTLRAIEVAQGTLLMVHACALADATGRTVVFVGPSGRGKSTLAATMGRSFGYVTDETVGITPDGRVLPYEKPLLLRTSAHGGKTPFSPDALHLLPAPTDPRLAGLILLDRDPYRIAPAALEPVDLADVIPLLIPETSALALLPDAITTLATLVHRAGGVYRASYRDAEQLIPLTREHLDRPSATASPRWRPAEGHEAVTDGTRVIVMAEGQVHVLDGILATVWRHAHLTGDELTRAVTRTHGPADNAADIVRYARQTLAKQGLHEHRPG